MPSYFNASDKDSKCAECDGGLEKYSLRCADCSKGAHLSCSGLSHIFLVRLATTRAVFTCSACIKLKAGEKLAEVVNEIRLLIEQERADGDAHSDTSLSQLLGNDKSLAPVPSAPSSSQMPPTQMLGSWVQGGAEGERDDGKNSAVEREQVPSLPEVADSLATAGVGASSGPRGKICKYYKGGNCRFGLRGDDCRFDHPKKCIKFVRFGKDARKGCNDNKCIFYHPPLCRNAESDGGCQKKKCKFFHRKATQAGTKQRAVAGARGTADGMGRTFASVAAVRPPRDQFEKGPRNVNLSESMTEPFVRIREARTSTADRWSGDTDVDLPFRSTEGQASVFRLLQEQVAKMEHKLQQLIEMRFPREQESSCKHCYQPREPPGQPTRRYL